jgi:uncharacterized membrane protein
MLIFVFCFLVASVAASVYVLARTRATCDWLRKRVDEQEKQIAALTRRVWMLEGGETAPAAEPETVPTEAEPELVAAEMPVAPVAVQSQAVSEDWETRVGAGWLNRAGALSLVVGVALFLGYSLTQLGPAGRIAIGFAIGLSLLAGGLVLDRQNRYRNFSYSLVGAGWAVVYFTAYAMYGLPAAKIIDNAAIAVALLLGVSLLMVAHSLRYRSEPATILAFLFGFVSLNVSPLTLFSAVASLFLSVSLIAVAYRLSWFRLPLAGVIFTYLTFVLRHDASVYGQMGILNGRIILWAYWFAFEIYELMDLRRRGHGRGIEGSLFLLNACGWIGASVLHQWRTGGEHWAPFLGASAILYLGDAILRRRLGQRGPQPNAWNGFEAAATASAVLMAAALIERFSGLGITLALLLEAEMVFVAGLSMQNRYLRNLGGVLLLIPFLRLLLVDAPGSAQMHVADLELAQWTPAGMVMTVVLAANRRLVPQAWVFAAGAGTVLFAILLAELPEAWVAPVWALLALASLLAGRSLAQRDLQWLSVPAAVFACAVAALFNIAEGRIATSTIVVTSLYALQFLWKGENVRVAILLSLLGTATLTALVAHEVQGRLLTVALAAEGAALLVAGFLGNERSFRLTGLALFLFCIAKVFVYDFREFDTGSRILSFILLGLMLLGASWVYARFRDRLRRFL